MAAHKMLDSDFPSDMDQVKEAYNPLNFVLGDLGHFLLVNQEHGHEGFFYFILFTSILEVQNGNSR